MGFRASEGKYCKRQKGKLSFLAACWLGSCRARAPPAPRGVFPSAAARAPRTPKLCAGAHSALLGLPGSLPVLLHSLFSNLPGVRAAAACGVCVLPGLGDRDGPFLISAAEGRGEEAVGYSRSGASTLACSRAVHPRLRLFCPKSSVSHAGPQCPCSSPPSVAGQAQWSVFSEAAGWLSTVGRGREPLQSEVDEVKRAARDLAPRDRGCKWWLSRAMGCHRVPLGLDRNSRQHPQPHIRCICLSRLQYQ